MKALLRLLEMLVNLFSRRGTKERAKHKVEDIPKDNYPMF